MEHRAWQVLVETPDHHACAGQSLSSNFALRECKSDIPNARWKTAPHCAQADPMSASQYLYARQYQETHQAIDQQQSKEHLAYPLDPPSKKLITVS
jgi:hypothetical protein